MIRANTSGKLVYSNTHQKPPMKKVQSVPTPTANEAARVRFLDSVVICTYEPCVEDNNFGVRYSGKEVQLLESVPPEIRTLLKRFVADSIQKYRDTPDLSRQIESLYSENDIISILERYQPDTISKKWIQKLSEERRQIQVDIVRADIFEEERPKLFTKIIEEFKSKEKLVLSSHIQQKWLGTPDEVVDAVVKKIIAGIPRSVIEQAHSRLFDDFHRLLIPTITPILTSIHSELHPPTN